MIIATCIPPTNARSADLRSAGVARVGFATGSGGGHFRPHEQESGLLLSDGAVIGAARDDEQVAGPEIDVAISQLDRDAALDNEGRQLRAGSHVRRSWWLRPLHVAQPGG